MKLLPSSLQTLLQELSRLPGVGEKSALRYSVSLLRDGPMRLQALQKALELVKVDLGHCQQCHFWTEQGQCMICSDEHRPKTRLCVVRDSPDVLSLERFKTHPWSYHVLQGLLSPLMGIGPRDIKLESLYKRLASDQVEEVILALDSTVEGDATAYYIRDRIKTQFPNIQLTRMSQGLPAGASVEYLDSSTLESALQNRIRLD